MARKQGASTIEIDQKRPRKQFALQWAMTKTIYRGYDVAMWLGPKEAERYIGFSADWVEVRAIPWPKDGKPIEGRIRFKKSKSDGRRRYYVPDLEAQLRE